MVDCECHNKSTVHGQKQKKKVEVTIITTSNTVADLQKQTCTRKQCQGFGETDENKGSDHLSEMLAVDTCIVSAKFHATMENGFQYILIPI